jgi:hypothetical protein
MKIRKILINVDHSVACASSDGVNVDTVSPLNPMPVSIVGGSAGGGGPDRELVVTTYTAKMAFGGASVGDTITCTQVLDVSGVTPVTVGTIWRNQTAAADLVAAPASANLSLLGQPGLTDTQLRASAVAVTTPGAAVFWNATTTPLGAGATFTGTSRDSGIAPGVAHHISYFTSFAIADQAGTLSLEGSNDGATWYSLATSTLVAATGCWLQVPVVFRYHRTKLVNGATAQTSLVMNSGYTEA